MKQFVMLGQKIKSNPMDLGAKPTSGNFASVVEKFQNGMIPLQRGRLANRFRMP